MPVPVPVAGVAAYLKAMTMNLADVFGGSLAVETVKGVAIAVSMNSMVK